MVVSNITTEKKQILTVYSARNYTKEDPCRGYVECNIPEVLPSTPTDTSTERFGLNANLFYNTNYPLSGSVTILHALTFPILSGTSYPNIFGKGTPFLLLTATGEVEDGYLIKI